MKETHDPKGLHNSFLAGTTPFPNVLIDQAMPRLKDSEWRLLCVIARQTLGWQSESTGRRKERDWLTRSQLMARTGRHSEALSAAIDTLMREGFITVQSPEGRCLTTPKERRRYRGRTYYSLTRPSLLDRKSEHMGQAACSIHRQETRKSEHVVSGKANTTKETPTKENETKSQIKEEKTNNHEKLTDRTMSTSHTISPAQNTPSALLEQDREAVKAFLDLFEKLAADYGKRAELQKQGDYRQLSTGEIQKLASLLQKNSALEWTLRLQRFFESDLEFIQRQHYSLAAFVNSYHLLEYSPRSR